jgi:hypothetical protein
VPKSCQQSSRHSPALRRIYENKTGALAGARRHCFTRYPMAILLGDDREIRMQSMTNASTMGMTTDAKNVKYGRRMNYPDGKACWRHSATAFRTRGRKLPCT